DTYRGEGRRIPLLDHKTCCGALSGHPERSPRSLRAQRRSRRPLAPSRRKPMEVFSHRIQRIRLQFGKRASKFLLNPVNHMEEGSTVHPDPAPAQPPIRTQQEMVTEDAMFCIVQDPAADETKIGHEFLAFTRECRPPFRSESGIQRY